MQATSVRLFYIDLNSALTMKWKYMTLSFLRIIMSIRCWIHRSIRHQLNKENGRKTIRKQHYPLKFETLRFKNRTTKTPMHPPYSKKKTRQKQEKNQIKSK